MTADVSLLAVNTDFMTRRLNISLKKDNVFTVSTVPCSYDFSETDSLPSSSDENRVGGGGRRCEEIPTLWGSLDKNTVYLRTKTFKL
jgi:hypothetical protein